MEQGDKARRDRISVDLSLREAAKILGVMPAIMSDFEWGRLVVGRMANLSERTHALYITHGLKE
jgi:predicted transcriptional regulator